MRFTCCMLLAAVLFRSVRADTIDELQSATVRIYATDSNLHRRALGAGVFVRPGEIITAYHVVQGFDSVEIRYGEPGKEQNLCNQPHIKMTNASSDLALIECRPENSLYSTMQLGPLSDVLPVDAYAYGHPDGNLNARISLKLIHQKVVSSDQLSDKNAKQIFTSNVPIIEFEGLIDPGMSGGGLVADGKLIGIISGTREPRGYVDRLGDTYNYKPESGIRWHNVSRFAAREYDRELRSVFTAQNISQ